MGEICSAKHLIGAWHAPKNFVSQIVSRDHKPGGWVPRFSLFGPWDPSPWFFGHNHVLSLDPNV